MQETPRSRQRRGEPNEPEGCWRPLPLAFALAFSALSAHAAGVRTDGSVGPALSLAGPNIVIPQNLGKVSGNNLFHSFQQFGIGRGESASFQTSVSGNVISRVTGGSASEINGRLSMTATGNATPAFWLINPAGIVFGAGAEISVPGAFHVATADYLRFADGTRFYADPSRSSSFSAAAPEAFGFLGQTRATLAVKDGAYLANYWDQMTLAGGDVLIKASSIENTTGDVRVVALGQRAGEVAIKGDLPTASGSLEVNGAEILTNTTGKDVGGNIGLAGGAIAVTASLVRASTEGAAASGSVAVSADSLSVASDSYLGSRVATGASGVGGDVNVKVAGDVQVSGASLISSDSYGSGSAGYVQVEAGNLTVDGAKSYVSSDAVGTGDAAGVLVKVSGTTRIANGAWISSDTYSGGTGGVVLVETGKLVIDGGGKKSGISAETLGGSSGAGGLVAVTTGDAVIRGRGRISTMTSGSGDAGAIGVEASSLSVDGTDSGILSDAKADSSGNAGYVGVAVTGQIHLANGAQISSSTQANGNAGTVELEAGRLRIESGAGIASSTSGAGDAGNVAVAVGALQMQGNGTWDRTGIFSNAADGSRGNAGSVKLSVSGTAELSRAATVSTNSYGGYAGDITVKAGTLSMNESGIFSRSYSTYGNAGSIDVVADSLQLANSASLSSSTWGGGSAGSVKVGANTIDIAGSGGIFSSALQGATGNAGKIDVTAQGSVRISQAGSISTNTFGPGDGGSIDVKAGSVSIVGDGNRNSTGIFSATDYRSAGSAGNISISTPGAVDMTNFAAISSNAFGKGSAGNVYVKAGSLNMDKAEIVSLIYSDQGYGGWIGLDVANRVQLSSGALISSSTYGGSPGGRIEIVAGQLGIDSASAISSSAAQGSRGDAGQVVVTVRDSVSIRDGGNIATNTFGPGNAGYIDLTAASVAIEGNGAQNTTGIFSASDGRSTGMAGNINITTTGAVTMSNAATISSNAFGQNHAGNITVKAGSLHLDKSEIVSRIYADKGIGGWIELDIADGMAVKNGSVISSDTHGASDAGYVAIVTGSLEVDGSVIDSNAVAGSSGDAGFVAIEAKGGVRVTNGGRLATNTAGSGAAGYVAVSAASLSIAGTGSQIAARAEAGSGGQTGGILLSTTGPISLTDGGTITIANGATIERPSSIATSGIYVEAPSVSLRNGSIVANSTGNVAASDIAIVTGDSLRVMQSSSISTSSVEGNGGAIGIEGGRSVVLDRSYVTTSVSSLTNGNGGNIYVGARFLVLNTGMIQANTRAANAAGGDIAIKVDGVVPSHNAVLVGGNTPHDFNADRPGFNVIQAAAPDGISGNIQITSPVLDLSGSVAGIQAQVLQTAGLGRSPCDTAAGSSLAATGQGGLPVAARDLLRVEPVGTSVKLPVAVSLASFKFVPLGKNCVAAH